MTAGSSAILGYQGLPSVYPMENEEEDSTEGTSVLPPSDQNNQIINKTLNYLPDKALADIRVKNHNN